MSFALSIRLSPKKTVLTDQSTVFTLSIRIPELLTITFLKFDQVQFVFKKVLNPCMATSVDPDETPHLF